MAVDMRSINKTAELLQNAAVGGTIAMKRLLITLLFLFSGLTAAAQTPSRTMPAWVIPEGTPESTVQDLLNEIHLGSVRGWAPYEKALQMRALVKGGLIVDIGLRGFLPASLVDLRRVRDLHPCVGQEIEARFTGVDRKTRTIALSIKAKEMHEEAEAVSNYRSEQGSSSGTSLGDLLKEQIGDR